MSRYIKTSDLITSLFYYKDQDGKTHTLPNRDCDNFPIYISVEEIKKAIIKTPTADVELVRHAHWIMHDKTLAVSFGESAVVGHYFECSSCGRTEDCEEPYCNCGAKMDEEVNQ